MCRLNTYTIYHLNNFKHNEIQSGKKVEKPNET